MSKSLNQGKNVSLVFVDENRTGIILKVAA